MNCPLWQGMLDSNRTLAEKHFLRPVPGYCRIDKKNYDIRQYIQHKIKRQTWTKNFKEQDSGNTSREIKKSVYKIWDQNRPMGISFVHADDDTTML